MRKDEQNTRLQKTQDWRPVAKWENSPQKKRSKGLKNFWMNISRWTFKGWEEEVPANKCGSYNNFRERCDFICSVSWTYTQTQEMWLCAAQTDMCFRSSKRECNLLFFWRSEQRPRKWDFKTVLLQRCMCMCRSFMQVVEAWHNLRIPSNKGTIPTRGTIPSRVSHHTVDGSEIPPVEVGSLSHDIPGFLHPRWWSPDFINSRLESSTPLFFQCRKCKEDLFNANLILPDALGLRPWSDRCKWCLPGTSAWLGEGRSCWQCELWNRDKKIVLKNHPFFTGQRGDVLLSLFKMTIHIYIYICI